jgi:hypothetical protein
MSSEAKGNARAAAAAAVGNERDQTQAMLLKHVRW